MGILFALLSSACFAANYVLVQLGMGKNSHKDNGVFLNILLNVPILGLIYLIIFTTRAEPINWSGTAFIAFIFAGICTTLLGRTTLFAAIRNIGSSRGAALKNAAPLFTISIAVLFLGEELNSLSLFGILLLFLGLFFLAYEQWKKNGQATNSKAWLGFLFGGLAACCFGVGHALRKIGLMHMSDPLLGAFIGASIALLIYCANLAIKGELRSTIVDQFKHLNLFYIFAGLATSFGALSFFLSASFTKVSYTSAIVATEPIITILFAYLFLREEEHIQRSMLYSVLCVFIGVVLIGLSTA